MRHFVKYILIAIGVLAIAYIRGHQIIINPHLTEAEAIGRYFWLWAIAAVTVLAGAWMEA